MFTPESTTVIFSFCDILQRLSRLWIPVESMKEKITVVLSGVNTKVHQVLEKADFYTLLGKENICPNINVALERAHKLVE